MLIASSLNYKSRWHVKIIYLYSRPMQRDRIELENLYKSSFSTIIKFESVKICLLLVHFVTFSTTVSLCDKKNVKGDTSE